MSLQSGLLGHLEVYLELISSVSRFTRTILCQSSWKLIHGSDAVFLRQLDVCGPHRVGLDDSMMKADHPSECCDGIELLSANYSTLYCRASMTVPSSVLLCPPGILKIQIRLISIIT